MALLYGPAARCKPKTRTLATVGGRERGRSIPFASFRGDAIFRSLPEGSGRRMLGMIGGMGRE